MDEPVSPTADADVPSPHQRVLYETSRTLAEAPTLADAAPRMLESVCRALHWQFGALWEVDRGRNVLRLVGMWQPPSQPFAEFAGISRTMTFTPGIGLPGRVWASGEPLWIPDVTRDSNFPRAAFARQCELHAAFAMPVSQGGTVIGVMEFFNSAIVQPTPGLLQLMTSVCSQLASFVERKWAAEEVHRFFTLSLDLFCVATFDGYFVRVNPAWERVLGFTDDELRAAPFMSFVHPDDREVTTKTMSALATGGHVIDFENRYRARDGSYKWLQWAAAPLTAQGLIYAAARDISDRKSAEEALLRYAADLERAQREQDQNSERLAQLVRELDIARQNAIRAATAKSAFLANMSHEIRTPMNAILGMTDLVLRTSLTSQQRDYINTARESAEALLTIIGDILDLSKIEAGRMTLDRNTFAFRDTVEDAVRLLAPRAAEKGLELACRIAPDIPDAVVGDAGRLRQVILNLVGNAVKFTDRGEVILDVVSQAETGDDVALRFCVTDTGIGVPPEKQWDIFGPFVQGDASTTRRFGGTGLGLTISAQLVELMGGRIWMESEVGKGSRFYFVAHFGRSTKPADVPEVSMDSLRDLRVLVVDDNATNRVILTEILTSWQMQAVAVEGAAAALSALHGAGRRGEPFDLVLTDALMPDTDGFALAAAIAGDEKLANTKVILLTSAGEVLVEASATARLHGQLTKPVKQSDLLDAIVTAFAARALGAVEPAARGAVPVIPRPCKVLVAEDNLTNQKLLVALLELYGHQVTVVPDGRQAVEASGREHFDVVLMDVQMPEMGGLEATAEIRAREQATDGHVPIIALTAHAMTGDRERCLEAGMDAYVSKPLRPAELFVAMARWCGASNNENAEAPAAAETRPGTPLDGSALLAAFGGHTELLRDAARVFLDDVPRMLQRLRTARDAADLRELDAAAHAIKGSAGLFSQGAAFDAARRVEQLARAGDDAAIGAVAELERAMTDLSGEVAALIA